MKVSKSPPRRQHTKHTMSVASDEASVPLLGQTSIPAYLRDQAALDTDSRFLTVAGLAVHYKRWSRERLEEQSKNTDVPINLLCMHGFGASLLSYEICVSPLRRLGNVVAFDTPGFGRTQRPSLRRLVQYTPAFVGGTLAQAFIDGDTGIPDKPGNPYVLMGHSMGALVALEAAAGAAENDTNNGNIRAIVLIAPAVVPVPSKLPRFIRILSAVWILCITLVLSPVLRLLLRRLINRRDFWQKGLAASRPSGTVEDNVVDAYMKPRLCTGVEWGLLNFVRAMAFYRASRGNIASRILATNSNDIPILLVHGESDKIIPIDNSRNLQALAPGNIELQIVKGGHCPHEENPEEFAAMVNSFLDRRLSPQSQSSALPTTAP